MPNIKKQTWVSDIIAECQDCPASWNNRKNAQAVAAKHAKKYGHLVRVEIELTSHYDGRKDQGKETQYA